MRIHSSSSLVSLVETKKKQKNLYICVVEMIKVSRKRKKYASLLYDFRCNLEISSSWQHIDENFLLESQQQTDEEKRTHAFIESEIRSWFIILWFTT
jgi:hypothetical protein